MILPPIEFQFLNSHEGNKNKNINWEDFNESDANSLRIPKTKRGRVVHLPKHLNDNEHEKKIGEKKKDVNSHEIANMS